MHIEKNVCGNFCGTLLNLDHKSKDNMKAFLDLIDMGIRPKLYPTMDSSGKMHLPLASFTLIMKKKIFFLKF